MTRKVQLERLLAEIEACGGAADPVHVLAVTKACRKMSGIISDFIDLAIRASDGDRPSKSAIVALRLRLESSVTIHLPELPS